MPIDIKDQYFGTEIEMTCITRERAAKAVGELFGTVPSYDGGYYGVWQVKDQEGKIWKFTYDGSITTQVRRNGRYVGASSEYSTEMVSPKLTYSEMGKLQEVVRCLRRNGARVNSSCGMHVHVDASNHTPRSIKNALTIMYSKEDILFKALKVQTSREEHYCQKVRPAVLEEIRKIEESEFAGEIVKLQQVRERQDIRLASLRLIVEEIKKRNIPGDAAELGVYQGMFAAEINRLLPEKKLYLFDTFYGFDDRDIEIEKQIGNGYAKAGDFSNTGIEVVKARLVYPEQAVFCPGYFPESLTAILEELPRFALVSLDPDLYEPVYAGLRIFYPLLSSGGMILVHDYNSMQFPGVKKAVEKFCDEQKIFVVPLMDLHGTAVIVKP